MTEQKWISVKDQMPLPSMELVLVYGGFICGTCDPRPKVRTARYDSYYSDGSDLAFNICGSPCLCDVTHWMPLPKPPGKDD